MVDNVITLPSMRAEGLQKRQAFLDRAEKIAAICKRSTGVTLSMGRVEVFFATDAEAEVLFDLLKVKA